MLPTEAELDRALDVLAAQYEESARLTGSPLRDLLARLLAVAVEFKDRADVVELEHADWIPGLQEGWSHLLQNKRKAPRNRRPPPRSLMTVREVAALMEWTKERTRRWLRSINVTIERSGNKDLVARRDVEKAAKFRIRLRQSKIGRKYKSR
jgi:hypothetical protein